MKRKSKRIYSRNSYLKGQKDIIFQVENFKCSYISCFPIRCVWLGNDLQKQCFYFLTDFHFIYILEFLYHLNSSLKLKVNFASIIKIYKKNQFKE